MLTLGDIDVLILAGGLGNRLRSQTGDTPKVLAQIQGVPFLDLLLSHLAQQGIRRIILCTGYKAQEVEARYGNVNLGLQIEFSRETTPLGTGGALKLAQEKIRSPIFFGLNGDCFCSLSYADLLSFHQEKKACASLVLNRVEDQSDFGSVILDSEQRILSFQEKSPAAGACYASTGIYCFNREVFNRMPSQSAFSIEREFFPSLVGKGFYGFVTDHPFLDIGTPDRYRRAQDRLSG